MRISLLTDAPKHNLALMKISAWHKALGNEVKLNMPLWEADLSYASILFDWNRNKFNADIFGGPAFCDGSVAGGLSCGGHGTFLRDKIPNENCLKPDYFLYPSNDFSLGYTFRGCPRLCGFCKVPILEYGHYEHFSIYNFYNSAFKKICLLNNNTFFDPHWKETFKEIWKENLSVVDENGYDLRLLDEERAEALHRTKWATSLHFAWDRISDELEIRRGLSLLEKYHLRTTANGVYVLIGYDTTEEEDIYRCQVINDYGLTPYPMPYVQTNYTKNFKRFINLHYYRKHKSIASAWRQYKSGPSTSTP